MLNRWMVFETNKGRTRESFAALGDVCQYPNPVENPQAAATKRKILSLRMSGSPPPKCYAEIGGMYPCAESSSCESGSTLLLFQNRAEVRRWPVQARCWLERDESNILAGWVPHPSPLLRGEVVDFLWYVDDSIGG